MSMTIFKINHREHSIFFFGISALKMRFVMYVVILRLDRRI